MHYISSVLVLWGNVMRFWIVGLLSVAVAGCVGKPVQEMSYSERNALAGQLVKRCMEQGVDPKSPQMTDCTKQEAMREITIRNKAEARRESGVICNPVGTAVICN